MTRNLDLDLLRTFVTVADSGSMTVAANLRHMTQGAVSQQVKRLEDLLDCLLFVRKTRKLELSRQGEQFLVKARQLLRLNDEIWADMTGQSLRGSLRVGVPYGSRDAARARDESVQRNPSTRGDLARVCGVAGVGRSGE